MLSNVDYSLRRLLLTGTLCSGVLVLGLGGWAVATNLAGAVVSSGTVTVEGQVKKIQHPMGGVITSILVKEGQRVKEGDLLLALDETTHKSTMSLYSKQMDEFKIRIARLEAEEKSLAKPVWSADIQKRMNELEVKKSITAELDLLTSRINSLEEQRKQLNEKIKQGDNEIIGIKSQHEGRLRDIALIKRELASVEGLDKKGYTTLSRLIGLKRDLSRTESERDNYKAELDKSLSRLQEAKVTLTRLDQDNKREVITELRDVKTRLNEVGERFISAEDAYSRSQIKSPYTGIAHQLNVNSIGGVVQPGESILNIVPDGEKLLVEAKIMQTDIDQVQLKQKAILRFTAFNQRTTPELIGTVTHISADLSKDKEAAYMNLPPYYTVRIVVDPAELSKLKDRQLQPGMSAEVFIQTESRSAMSYLMKPMTDQMSRAFKER